jgi:HK97 family phage major capsid protein
MNRRQAIAKATTTTTVASGALLTPEQSRRFREVIKESSSFGKAIRQEPVGTPSGTINKLATSSRIIRAAQENADDGYRAEPTFPDVPYDTTKIRLPFEVTEEVFEENIEKEALEAKLVNSFATQMGLDLDDLDINGDTAAGAGPDQAFLQIHDGLLKLIDGDAAVHDVDGSAINGGALSLAHFFAAIREMPNKYRNLGNLRWFMSPLKASQWVEALTERATAAGDTAIGGSGTLATSPLGVPILGADDGTAGISFWPDDRIVLADPRNIVRSIFRPIKRRRVTGDTDWELATRDKRGYIFFIREGISIEESDAVVNVHTLDE